MFMLSTDAPILEVYYAATCAPCRQEIPLLAEISATSKVVVYVLDKAIGLDKVPPQPTRAVFYGWQAIRTAFYPLPVPSGRMEPCAERGAAN